MPYNIRRRLNSVRKSGRKVIHNDDGRIAILAADVPGWNQFCIGIRGNPQPHGTGILRRLLSDPHILLLCVNKAPKLINLNTFAG
jgi:hypothetical protein